MSDSMTLTLVHVHCMHRVLWDAYAHAHHPQRGDAHAHAHRVEYHHFTKYDSQLLYMN